MAPLFDDRDQLYVGLSISGQDLLHVHPRKPGEILGALKAIGAKGRELIYMILFMAGPLGADRLRPGRRSVTLMMLDRPAPGLPQKLCRDDHVFWNLGLALGMVHTESPESQAMSGTQSPQNRALRHLQGVAMLAPFPSCALRCKTATPAITGTQ